MSERYPGEVEYLRRKLAKLQEGMVRPMTVAERDAAIESFIEHTPLVMRLREAVSQLAALASSGSVTRKATADEILVKLAAGSL